MPRAVAVTADTAAAETAAAAAAMYRLAERTSERLGACRVNGSTTADATCVRRYDDVKETDLS